MQPLRRLAVDCVPAVLLAGLALVDVSGYAGDERALLGAACLGITLPLAARRTRALAVYLAITASLALIALRFPGYESVAILFALVLGTFAVAQREDGRTAALAALAGAGAVALAIARDPTDSPANIPPSVLLFVVLPWGAGFMLRRWQLRSEVLTEQAAQATENERRRIARELHDVVAHSVSVMVVQAQAAQRIAATDPAGELEALRAIEQSGRSALVELRRLLGVLRADDSVPARTPQPGIDRIAALADEMRAAGLDVVVRIEGETAAIPAGVDVSAYRIVQEALTNTLKHAGRVRAEVAVRALDGSVEVEVLDSGLSQSEATAGFGLTGMRERVRLLGGTLAVGPRDEGGFAVRAELPL